MFTTDAGEIDFSRTNDETVQKLATAIAGDPEAQRGSGSSTARAQPVPPRSWAGMTTTLVDAVNSIGVQLAVNTWKLTDQQAELLLLRRDPTTHRPCRSSRAKSSTSTSRAGSARTTRKLRSRRARRVPPQQRSTDPANAGGRRARRDADADGGRLMLFANVGRRFNGKTTLAVWTLDQCERRAFLDVRSADSATGFDRRAAFAAGSAKHSTRSPPATSMKSCTRRSSLTASRSMRLPASCVAGCSSTRRSRSAC
jgi:hypothetical protein